MTLPCDLILYPLYFLSFLLTPAKPISPIQEGAWRLVWGLNESMPEPAVGLRFLLLARTNVLAGHCTLHRRLLPAAVCRHSL